MLFVGGDTYTVVVHRVMSLSTLVYTLTARTYVSADRPRQRNCRLESQRALTTSRPWMW